MATAPSWITSPNLGVYSETYSFNINPLVVEYSAPSGNTVAQINGALPSGLSWGVVNGNVEVSGETTEVFADTVSAFTWRITGPDGQVADRTYYMQINPVAIPPSWFGQEQFLGYAASGNTSVYTVTAHSTSNINIAYSIPQFSPPPGLSINGGNGLITYSAPVVSSDQTISFPVRATTGSVYSDLSVTIDLLTVPHAPVWYTRSGLLEIVTEGDFIEIDLVAYDSSGAPITYALVNSVQSWPFTLTATGLVYGQVPQLFTTTVYQFTVSATSANGTATQTMDIIAEPVAVGSLLYWNSSSDCGTIYDGAYVTLDVSATSKRSVVINYSIVGGILPRGLILNSQNGLISGFAEFQTRDRSYLFDVQAYDGMQKITRTFSVTILRSTQYQYLGITIPVEGSLKDIYYGYIGETINSTWVPYSSTTPQSVLYPPFIQLIQGLNYAIDDPAAAVYFANLSLNTTEIMIGAATNVNVSPSTTLFYSPILDANAGAAAQYAQADNVAISATATLPIQAGTVTVIVAVDSGTWLDSAVPGTTVRLTADGKPSIWMQGSISAYVAGSSVMVIAASMTSGSGTYSDWQLTLAPTYPPSLVNMRDQLIAGLGWVTDGQGSGAALLPVIDPTSTAVIGAQIVDPGVGYLYGPGLTVIGTGNGAVIAANLTLISANVAYGGTGWSLGDQIQLEQPAVTPAVLTVSGVSNGSVTGLTITTPGEYVSFPAGDTLITNGDGAPARIKINLGVGNVWVSAGGSNYFAGGSTISTAGSELLPSWQATWEPYLGLGTVFTEYGGKVVGNETTSTTGQLFYQRWPLQHAILEMQGINWTGDTTFDHESTSFDGGATFWGEWTEPRDTLFDQNQTVFNQDNTVFNNPYALWQDYAYYAWGTTQFDSEFTIFDLYATIFDTGATPTASITQLRRLLRITTQQISGHDVVV